MKYSKSVSNLLVSFVLLASNQMLQAQTNTQQAQPKLPQSAINQIEQMMTQHYGNQYDQQRQCLQYTYQYTTDYGDSYQERYCMKVANTVLKVVNGRPTVYMLVSGDMVEDEEQSVGHVDSGLAGLFVLTHHFQFIPIPMQWQVSASEPYIANGQWGKSQMVTGNGSDGFELVPVGQNKFGWVGEFYGSGAGGESSSQWVMYAPIANKIQEVADFEIAHDYMGFDEWKQTEGNVKILTQEKMSDGFYPLQVNLTHHVTPAIEGEPIESKSSSKKESYQLIFDASTNKFKR